MRQLLGWRVSVKSMELAVLVFLGLSAAAPPPQVRAASGENYTGRSDSARNHVNWNGYTQLRYSQGRHVSSFAIRRAKLWIKGATPSLEDLSFKVQGIFRPSMSGAFVLQDVYAKYDWHSAYFRVGQMVPDYSLQWQQPDAVIPLIERSLAVNILIPSATTLARDIGAQLAFDSANGIWHAGLGLFNGNGANHFENNDEHFLVTTHATCTIPLRGEMHWRLGSSVAYRETEGMEFRKILGTDKLFAGNDFRWGVETHLQASRWEFQAEYLQANLGGELAWGTYGLVDFYLSEKNQLVASVEKLIVPNPDSTGDPWYILGFNHYIRGNKAKVVADLRAQFPDGPANYLATIQFQLFFRE